MAVTRSEYIVFLIGRYRCDFWSTAVVILEAALGYYPFTSGSTHFDVCNICRIEYQLEKEITDNKATTILRMGYHFIFILQRMRIQNQHPF